MTEREIVVTGDMPLVGAKCAYCGKELQAGDLAVVCPRCKKPHHSRCWKEKAGCATLGCPQVAEAVRAEKTDRAGDRLAQAAREGVRRRRTWLTIAAVVIAAGVMIAGFGLGTFGTRREAADKRAVITVLLPVSAESPDLTRIAEKFNRQSRDSRVEMSIVPFGAYEQKLVVLLAAQDAPDVFALPPDRFELFASRGVFLRLDSPDGPDQAAPGNPPAEWLKYARVGDILYGFPHPRFGQILGIAAASKHPQAAREFLKFYFANLQPADMEGSPRKGPQNPQSLPFGPGIF